MKLPVVSGQQLRRALEPGTPRQILHEAGIGVEELIDLL